MAANGEKQMAVDTSAVSCLEKRQALSMQVRLRIERLRTL
jgi:hypothetical protein